MFHADSAITDAHVINIRISLRTRSRNRSARRLRIIMFTCRLVAPDGTLATSSNRSSPIQAGYSIWKS